MKKIKFMALLACVTLAFFGCASEPKSKNQDNSKTQEPPATETQVAASFDRGKVIIDTKRKPMKDISGLEILVDMKTGWNLGNTLDATGSPGLNSETSWGQPHTTKEMIDAVAKAGFKTIRIPTSWHNHIIDRKYTIDPEWMKRVKEIVDWAIENDMYVVLNTHHDNFGFDRPMPYKQGYYPSAENETESISFLKNVWGQIALAFNNGYDEHLVFETLNEPRLCGTNYEWNYNASIPAVQDAMKQINKFNQLIVDTIRASNGNNAKRLIICPSYACSPAAALSNEFVLPTDSANMVGVAVHMYDPYPFAMDGNGPKDYSPRYATELSGTFNRINDKFIKKGIPAYIGEYGAVNKDNTDARVQWFSTFIKQTHVKGIPCFLWDNQAVEKDSSGYSEKFGFFNRGNLTWFFPELTEAIMKSCE